MNKSCERSLTLKSQKPSTCWCIFCCHNSVFRVSVTIGLSRSLLIVRYHEQFDTSIDWMKEQLKKKGKLFSVPKALLGESVKQIGFNCFHSITLGFTFKSPFAMRNKRCFISQKNKRFWISRLAFKMRNLHSVLYPNGENRSGSSFVIQGSFLKNKTWILAQRVRYRRGGEPPYSCNNFCCSCKF